ncbi:PAS domain-containing protein [Mycolicibacterium arenosum]|uniref:PAS domain-containing protein n=1 Tax=Mycolicibacterium arenosum TaxID=2952157 RepID=A0ABT1MCB1_9MYCO|nr:PAS domain-containing protein [Mycolicibacterium sp. CAU 1645]MCP9276808.1 PAS domain-containing protein [Mycolicibacterium sp. CAU 1645]
MADDRRRRTQPTDLAGLLDQLPARVLLDRMPGAVLGLGLDGVVAYSNPAAVSLFGYLGDAMLGLSAQTLLAEHPDATPQQCISVLRAAGRGDVVTWRHAEGFAMHTAISTPLLLRATDPFLMIYITDETESHWDLRTRAGI